MRRDDHPLPDPGAADRPDQHWMCGRRGDQTPCQLGPSRRGRCPMAGACRPRRTWAGGARRASAACLVVIVGILGWIGASAERSAVVFKPGGLASPHAQILSQSEPASRCAVCHTEASLSPASWFDWGGKAHDGVSQTDRCLDCHHESVGRDRARLAHGLTREQRRQLRSAPARPVSHSWHDRLPSPAVSMEDVQCSACHREHQGRDGDLLAVSDAQCQTCHADRFGRFADGHPEWTGWPYGRGGRVAFDHASHAAEHYPATLEAGGPRSFDCDSCHRRTAHGEIVRSPSYEDACRECHDETLRVESAEGFALVALPTLPEEVTAAVPAWPPLAQGFADGQLAALAELLMREDASAERAAARVIGGDFSRFDPADPDQRQTARTLAAAHHRLLQEAAGEGQPALLRRFEAAGIPSALAQPLVRSLPPQLIESAYRQWFGRGGTAVSGAPRWGGRKMTFQFPQSLSDGRREAGDASPRVRKHTNGSRVAPRRHGFIPSLRDSDEIFRRPPRTGARGYRMPSLRDFSWNTGRSTSRRAGNVSGWVTHGGTIRAVAFGGADDLLLGPAGNESDDAVDGLAAGDALESGASGDELLGGGSLGEGDPLSFEGDPLSEQNESAPSAEPMPGRFDAAAKLPAGGWYRDDLRLAIRYRAAGHADPVLTALVEILSALPADDPARQRLLARPAVSACVRCHPAAVESSRSWTAPQLAGRPGTFTRFSHRPHLNIQELADCSHCHALRTGAEPEERWIGAASDAGSPELPGERADRTGDFQPLRRESCAACHTARAAGDRCTQCHRYHVDADQLTWPSR